MKARIGNNALLVLLGLGLAAAATVACHAQSPTADDFNPGASFPVEAMAVQVDGRILVGGPFTMLGGQGRNRIGRLSSRGTVDPTFNPGASSAGLSLAVQADGKILVGGFFTTLGGQGRNYIGRLNSRGTLDPTFNPGAGGPVGTLALQADGKILAGGLFTTLGGQPRNYIGRLNSDGTVDLTFNPGASDRVSSLALQADGKILVGGSFTTLGGQRRNYIGRLNSDGTLDTTFNPGANGHVGTMVVQADGKIVVGGSFRALGGQRRNHIGRLNSDGTVDPTFNPVASGLVGALALQADGKILAGGLFTTLGGQPRNYIGRLNSDGTVDPTFNPGASSAVLSLALQADGKILVGGFFTTLGGQGRNYIGRLNNTDPAAQGLSYDGSNLTWLRGGTSPEVWRTTFEVSSNGIEWLNMGSGTRITGGWQLTGVSVDANVKIRARGFVAGGHFNNSGWFVESSILTRQPYILSQPANQTNNVGTDAKFSVVVQGTPRVGYLWYRDGADIAVGTTSSLLLTNVQESDQGLYSVVASNAFGSVTSSMVSLVVNQPPVADASATQPFRVSPNGLNANVVLDGSHSSDPDGDSLTYTWFSGLPSIVQGAVAVVSLPVGVNGIDLVVDDGLAKDTNSIAVSVLTTAEAVEHLIALVNESDLQHKQPLLATLEAALASIERGNHNSATGQLGAFQNKVATQVSDTALATELITGAGEAITALNCEGSVQAVAKIHGLKRHPNGKMQMKIKGQAGKAYIVEASTNLVDWEAVGLAAVNEDGSFDWDDAEAAKHQSRFYRVVMSK